MTAIITAILSAAAAFVGSWLAAQFALERFKSEKIWERRAAAYTAIFEAFHEIELMVDQQLLDERMGRKRPLKSEYGDAQRSIAKRVAAEAWLLSVGFLNRIAEFTEVMPSFDPEPISYLEAQETRIKTAIEDLRVIARKDLSVEVRPWFRSVGETTR